jgi:sigma-B regulation protein RsbU (phosphoserine phosphatase)
VNRLSPQVLVLDVGLPDIDGFEVCRRIRADPRSADLPVLFLSASSSVGARVAGLRAGAVDFLAKPFEPAELAARVRAHLELVRLRESLAHRNRELARANAELRGGIAAAARIQAAMLPRAEIQDPRVRFAWRCLQCEQLGGDAVNVLRISPDCYAFYVLDASGHGVPASLLAVATGYFMLAMCSGFAAREVAGAEEFSPAAVLGGINRLLRAAVPEGVFVTMACGVLHARKGDLTFSAAGHPGPLLCRGSGGMIVLDGPSPPAGIGDCTFENQRVRLCIGDRVLFYSDGLYEQRDPQGVRAERPRVAHWVARCRRLPIQQAVTRLVHSLEQWRGTAPIDDDVVLLGIDFAGGDL